MKKQLSLTLLFLGLFWSSHAQLSRYTFNGDLNMKMSLRYGSLNNTKIEESEAISGVVFRFFDLGVSNYSGKRLQYSGRWATLPETFSQAFFDVVFTQNFEWFSYQPNVTLIGDFILGWHNFTWALYRTEDLQVSAGINAHDYFYAYQPESSTDVMEPAGWYIGTGPAAMLDYNLFNKLVLHVEGSYTYTAKVNDVPDMQFDRSYPSSHFMNFLLELRPESRWFLGFEHVRSFNRGWMPNDGTRTDIHVGLKLFVDE